MDGEEDPFTIHHLSFCPDSRLLAVAGATPHVLQFKFTKQETTAEILVRFLIIIQISIHFLDCDSSKGIHIN